MTKKEFMELTRHPNRRCLWGGKEYRIKSLSKPAGTVFLGDLHKTDRRPYAVAYESVTLL